MVEFLIFMVQLRYVRYVNEWRGYNNQLGVVRAPFMEYLDSFEGAVSVFADLLCLEVLEFGHFNYVVLEFLKYFLPAFKIYAHASCLLFDLCILDGVVGVSLQAGVHKTANFIGGFLQVLFELDADHILLGSVEGVVMARLLVVEDIVGQDDFLGAELVRSPENFLQQVVLLERWPIADGPVGAGAGRKLLDGAIPVEEVRVSGTAGNF